MISNNCLLRFWEEVVLLSVDMWTHKNGLSYYYSLKMSLFQGYLSILVLFEAHETGSIVPHIKGGGVNGSKWFKDCSKCGGVECTSNWDVLNKKIGIFFSNILSLILFRMNRNLDFLPLLHRSIEFPNGISSTVLRVELNISKSSALSILENFEFAGLDGTVFRAKCAQLFLIHLLWEVSHEHVSLAVKVSIHLLVEHDLLSVNFGVVHGSEASVGFFCGEEVQVTEAF